MSAIRRARPSRFARIYRALLVPTLILGFALAITLTGCAALDEAAVARTDRLTEAPYYKPYRAGMGSPEPALLLPLAVDRRESGRLEPLRAAIDDYLRQQCCCRTVDDGPPATGAPLNRQAAADQLLWNLLRRFG